MEPFIVTTPGKVILFGEHSAVYGKKVIAGVLQSLRTYLYVDNIPSYKRGNKDYVLLDFPNIGLYYVFDKLDIISYCTDLLDGMTNVLDSMEQLNSELVDRILNYINLTQERITKLDNNINIDTNSNVIHKNAIVCFIYLYLIIFMNENRNGNGNENENEMGANAEFSKHVINRFILKSGIPIGAGLGSSASICVSLSHAMLQLFMEPSQINNEIINKFAFIGEKCIHGTPSGIDNTVVTYGGIISYVKNETMSYENIIMPDDVKNDLDLLIVDTKVTRSTKQILKEVKKLNDSLPKVVNSIWDAMQNISDECEHCLQNGDLTKLPDLIKINQNLLRSINVSHSTIDKIVSLTEELNIGTTKLTGAGKGGCTISLINRSDSKQNLLQQIDILKGRLYKENCSVYKSKLGGNGTILIKNNKITEQIRQVFENDTVSTTELTETMLPLL